MTELRLEAAQDCHTADTARLTEQVATSGEAAEEQTEHCQGCQESTDRCRVG